MLFKWPYTQDSPPARVVLSTLSYVQEEMFFAKLLLRGEPQRPKSTLGFLSLQKKVQEIIICLFGSLFFSQNGITFLKNYKYIRKPLKITLF